MVKIYIRKIKEGDITIEEVPFLWRSKVEEALELE